MQIEEYMCRETIIAPDRMHSIVSYSRNDVIVLLSTNGWCDDKYKRNDTLQVFQKELF